MLLWLKLQTTGLMFSTARCGNPIIPAKKMKFSSEYQYNIRANLLNVFVCEVNSCKLLKLKVSIIG